MTTDIVYVKTTELPVTGGTVRVRFGEFFFDFRPPDERTDVCVGRSLKERVPGWLAYPTTTRIIELSTDSDALFKSFSKNNRYKIERAARRDDVQTEFSVAPAADAAAEFVRFYDTFAQNKGVATVERSQFEALARTGKLVVSLARSVEGDVLAGKAYVLDHGRARLTHSASLFRLQSDSAERNRIGRVNRLLHWRDIQGFRELGATAYDMGGWYTGDRDEGLLSINAFKREFGGEVVQEWDLFHPGSARGWLYLRARDAWRRARPRR